MGDLSLPQQPSDETEALDQTAITSADATPLISDEPGDEETLTTSQAGISQVIAIVQEGVQYLDERLNTLQRGFDQKLKYDEQKDKTIQKLHAELETHRQGLYAQMLRPLALDVIRLYNDLSDFFNALKAFCSGIDSPTSQRLLGNLSLFFDEIEEILKRNGFAIISTAPETPVQPKYHRLLGTEPTSDPDLNQCVAVSLKKGLVFQRLDGEQIFQPETVKAFRYTPTANQPDTSEATSSDTEESEH